MCGDIHTRSYSCTDLLHHKVYLVSELFSLGGLCDDRLHLVFGFRFKQPLVDLFTELCFHNYSLQVFRSLIKIIQALIGTI